MSYSRDLDIIRLRLQGNSYQSIGNRYFLSRARIQQILLDHNILVRVIKFKPEGLEKQFVHMRGYFRTLICTKHNALKRFCLYEKKAGYFYCTECAMGRVGKKPTYRRVLSPSRFGDKKTYKETRRILRKLGGPKLVDKIFLYAQE